ncbi:nucleotidyltransferase family protein [Brevibacterium oceani]|uniref:nucleotidyltransferase family protein n=1 Tax=Brevibacterium oceani TaxID=358099 RepID=UPI001B335942|nr:nucleotidyltransferase domain-containing protein [Brevibacterium oceani]
MESAIEIDADAVAELCREYGVARLRIFGSAVTGEFDPASSDVDFIVDFLPGRANLFQDYFGLLEGLTVLMGRRVDLVVGRSLRNPHFRESALRGARDVFAA